MQITLTEHAKQRMIERRIPPIEKLNVRAAGRNLRKKIKELCPQNGYNSLEFIYLSCVFCNFVHIFVCKQINIGQFLCITAFKYELNQQNKRKLNYGEQTL